MESNFTKLFLHTEVRWLSRGKVLNRVFALREQFCVFFTEEANPMAVKCQDVLWLAKLSYMASIFDHLNKLNISQQGKGGNVFTSIGKINSLILKLRGDYSQKAVFKTFSHPMDFWVTLLDIPEYKDLAEQAIAIFVQMPTSYLCEQGFSSLVLIKTKKRNAILNLDTLMRVALENRLTPRFNLIADKVQQQPSH
ncbi:protein FAM200A-like [Oratosquilla oratoria]|uniref:protein FAM200A-like n=1 Tax=Oratosquilla oratoria TaxID=337810 RepID=UPI003F775E55